MHSRAFHVPHIINETILTKLKEMVKLTILRKDSDSSWVSPTFDTPKADSTTMVVYDFRSKRLPSSKKTIPKISRIMQELERFSLLKPCIKI